MDQGGGRRGPGASVAGVRPHVRQGGPGLGTARAAAEASLLITLNSVRSERAFCEELAYNLLFRWFLDMGLIERSFDATVFTKNR